MTQRLVKRMPVDLPWWRHAAAQYRRGASLRTIADGLGVSHETVRHALVMQGVKLRKRGRPISVAWAEDARSMQDDGFSLAMIAGKLGVSKARVWQVLREMSR